MPDTIRYNCVLCGQQRRCIITVIVGIVGPPLLACLVAGAGSLVFSLGDEAVGVIETLPDAAHKVRQAVRAKLGGGESAIEKMQMAAESHE